MERTKAITSSSTKKGKVLDLKMIETRNRRTYWEEYRNDTRENKEVGLTNFN